MIERDRKYSSANKGRREEIIEEHRAIVDAMAAADVPAAELAVSGTSEMG